MNIKRLDDPTIPVASTLVGLIIYGMQGGQTVKVTPTLLEGSDGVDGINGKSAYQVAVDNGFVGTAAQWLDSLIGNSAYDLWVDGGGVGTVDDYIAWLREPSVTAAGYATEQGDYALAQGNYAKAQGDYALAQGNYAKAQGDYAKDQGDYVAGLQILNSVEYGETEYNEI